MDVKRALVWVERVPETFLKSSQASSLHKLQESTAPRLCTSREREFGSSNSLRRSRSLYRLQHVSLHQLQQGRHRAVLAKTTQAELCKLGVCYQQKSAVSFRHIFTFMAEGEEPSPLSPDL